MVGYKVQVTKTCDPACKGPHVITNVETTPATTPDDNMVAVVHQSLAKRGLLPGEHLVDKGYTASHVLVDSQQNHSATIIGLVADDPSWQARLDDGLIKAEFEVDCASPRRGAPARHNPELGRTVPKPHTSLRLCGVAGLATANRSPRRLESQSLAACPS